MANIELLRIQVNFFNSLSLEPEPRLKNYRAKPEAWTTLIINL
jgi:hypothetical protein